MASLMHPPLSPMVKKGKQLTLVYLLNSPRQLSNKRPDQNPTIQDQINLKLYREKKKGEWFWKGKNKRNN